MTLIRPIRSMAVIFTFCLLVAGCGQNPEQKLIGTWQLIGGNKDIFEFLKDGSFIVKSEKNEIGSLESMKGKWQVLSDGRLKMDVSGKLGLTASQVVKLTFERKEMIFTDGKGKSTRLINLK